jgi:hypothetical protein
MTTTTRHAYILVQVRRGEAMTGIDTRSPHSNIFDHDTVHPDNEGDEKDEDRDENASESNPDVTGGHERPDRGDMHLRLRTRQRWSKSDERRLLAYKNKLSMEWDDIFRCFSGHQA